MRFSTLVLCLAIAVGALSSGCGDDASAADAAAPALDADSNVDELSPDVYLPDAPDARDPLDFTPADSPDAEPAHNPNTPLPDAELEPDAAPPGPRNCLQLAAGDEHVIDAKLEASRTWRRIEPDACPATLLTDREVAYKVHWVCAWPDAVMLDVAMLGSDKLAQDGTISDPVLVAYESLGSLSTDPFDCLAANDDGMFEEGIDNSARIEQLAIGAGERVAIVATSYERPDQHGIGAYRLELRAH